LTLVRRIKQKLFREGKLRKYFIYALGEIILVMIGILLALQINNWNQERIERTKEIKALSALDKEFELNHKRITTKQNLRNLIVPKIDSYITLIETGKADYYSFKDFHLNQIMHGMTNPSNGVINALISSGEISLITNDSLKYFLADWKNQLENLYENELILWNSELKFIETTQIKFLTLVKNGMTGILIN